MVAMKMIQLSSDLSVVLRKRFGCSANSLVLRSEISKLTLKTLITTLKITYFMLQSCISLLELTS
jgi:hypothetical protein